MTHMYDQEKELLVFWHLAKTGGTSFINHLFASFGQDYSKTPVVNDYQYLLARQEGRIYWPDAPILEKKKAVVVSGHCASIKVMAPLMNTKKIFFTTIIREPTARIVSDFNYSRFMKTIPDTTDLIDYCKIKQGLSWTYFLCKFCFGWEEEECLKVYDEKNYDNIAEKIISILVKFSFIGFQENYDSDAKVLTDYLGIERVKRKDLAAGDQIPILRPLTSAVSQACKNIYVVDYLVYNYFLERKSTEKTDFTNCFFSEEN